MTGHFGGVESVSFSRNGEYIASGSMDGTIGLCKVPSGEHLKPSLDILVLYQA